MNTPSLLEALFSGPHWGAVLITFAATGGSVLLHYESLRRLNLGMPRWRLERHRRVLAMILCMLAVHVVEIWIFGLGLFAALQIDGMGSIVGDDSIRVLDAVYLSATTYSTLGYGDLVPHGPIRFLLGTEALVGLLLITWSASFTYLEMQRFWRNQ